MSAVLKLKPGNSTHGAKKLVKPRADKSVNARSCATELLEVVPAVMDALRAAMRAHVGEQLSVPQFRCLNYVSLNPGCSVSTVAAFLGVTMPTASAMVDRLVRAGALESMSDTADRRRIRLHAAPSGLAQLQQIRQGARSDLANMLSDCDAAQMQSLLQGLDVLKRHFGSESNLS